MFRFFPKNGVSTTFELVVKHDGSVLQQTIGYGLPFETDDLIIAGAIRNAYGNDLVVERDGTFLYNQVTNPAGQTVWYDAEVLADSPAMYWADTGGALAYDESGNARHGNYLPAAVVGGHAKTAGPTGDGAWATDLSGTLQYLAGSTTYLPFVTGSQRTFECWASIDSFAAIRGVFTSSDLRAYANITTARAVTFDADNTGAVTWAAAWPNDANYHHFALTYDESTQIAELFIDGVSQGTKTAVGLYQVATQAASIWFGRQSTNYLDGKIAKCAVYHSILSSARILAHYNARSVAGPRPFADQVKETFSGSSLANYAYQTGTGLVATALTEAGGVLTTPTTGGRAIHHTARTYTDVEQTVKITLQSTAGIEPEGIIIKGLDGDNHILARFQGEGLFRIYKRVAGVETNLLSMTLSAGFVSGDIFWVRASIAGNVVSAELWTAEPSPGGTPAYSGTTTLTGADATQFGTGVAGYAGLRTSTLGATFDDHIIRPLNRPSTTRDVGTTYRVRQQATSPAVGIMHAVASSKTSVTPGNTYSYGVLSAQSDAYAGGTLTGIAWFDSSDRLISTDTGAALYGSAVAPATAATAAVIHGGLPGAADTIDVNATMGMFLESATAIPYFDGDTVTPKATWEGTAHASRAYIRV